MAKPAFNVNLWSPDPLAKEGFIPSMPLPAYARMFEMRLAQGQTAHPCEECHPMFFHGNFADHTIPWRGSKTCPIHARGIDNYKLALGLDSRITFDSPNFAVYAPEPDGETLEELAAKLEATDLTAEVSGLGPLEAHFMRLFIFTRGGSRVPGDLLYQLRCVFLSIAALVFPDVPVAQSLPATELFVQAVLAELARNLARAPTGRQQTDLRAFAKVFGAALGDVMPGVWAHLEDIALRVCPGNKSEYEAAKGAYGVVLPFSWKQQLIPFLVDPVLRKQAPVTYHYQRLQGSFHRILLLPPIVSVLAPVFNRLKGALDTEEGPDFDALADDGWADDDGFFSQAWTEARDIVANGLMTPAARKALEIPEDAFVPPVCPVLFSRLDEWPALIVLEGLSHCHNEFLRILQRHATVSTRDVSDVHLIPQSDPNKLDLTPLNRLFITSYRGKLRPDGVPAFDGATEKAFIAELSKEVYSYILHPLINVGITPIPIAPSESVPARFARLFTKGRASFAVDEDQRIRLIGTVKQKSRGPGLMMFLERVMLKVLNESDAVPPSRGIVDYWTEKYSDQKLPLIEEAGKKALINAKSSGASRDFTIGQLAKIYDVLAADDAEYNAERAQTLGDKIVYDVMTKFGIHPNEIFTVNLVEKEEDATKLVKLGAIKRAAVKLLSVVERKDVAATVETSFERIFKAEGGGDAVPDLAPLYFTVEEQDAAGALRALKLGDFFGAYQFAREQII
jgi:hypothetical protein